MNNEQKQLRRSFSQLIGQDEVLSAIEFYRDNQTSLPIYAAGGANWLQFAIKTSSLEMVTKFHEMGMSLNDLDERGEVNALTYASQRGSPEIMEFCLTNKAKVLTGQQLANPLFACMPGKIADQHEFFGSDTPPENYLTIAKMLIDHGIDTTIRYDMSSNDGQIDAMMFALLWYREDIAHMIADHQAEGDAAKTEKLLNEAKAAVDALPAFASSDFRRQECRCLGLRY